MEDYEELRWRNIERNNQKLRELQLFGVSIAESASSGDGNTPAPKRRKIKRAPVPTGPTRASGRERKRSQASLESEASERHQLEVADDWPGLGPADTKPKASKGKRICEDCRQKEPSWGQHQDDRWRWCWGCAQQHPGAVVARKARGPCEDCRRPDPTHGMPGGRKRRWCQSCAQLHPQAVRMKQKKARSDSPTQTIQDPTFEAPPGAAPRGPLHPHPHRLRLWRRRR